MRIALSVALLVVYAFHYWNDRIPVIASSMLIMVSYFVLLMAKDNWLTKRKLAFLSSCIIVVSVVAYEAFGASTENLLWPLVYILASTNKENSRVANVLAALAIFAALITNYAYPLPFALLLSLAALFFGIRIRWIRQQAYELSQRHVKELNQAHKELQETTIDSMRYAALEERTRLAREIHDGLGHQLTSMIVQLQALQIMLTDAPESVSKKVDQLLDISRQLIGEVRTAVKEWSEDESGLGLVALKGLVSHAQGRSSIQFEFIQESEISEWPLETSSALYRILQESITNALRHSNAMSVTVTLRETEDRILLAVNDDGTFTEDKGLTPGFGLTGIQERCSSLGGTCRFVPLKPHGFGVEVALPIASDKSI